MNIILVFTGKHCAGCGKLEASILNRKGKIADCSIEFIDAEKRTNQSLLNKYGVSSLPTTVVLKDNKVLRNIVGYGRKTLSEIEALL